MVSHSPDSIAPLCPFYQVCLFARSAAVAWSVSTGATPTPVVVVVVVVVVDTVKLVVSLLPPCLRRWRGVWAPGNTNTGEDAPVTQARRPTPAVATSGAAPLEGGAHLPGDGTWAGTVTRGVV